MIKIDVVSGFLGAGKTTLIKKLLKEALNGQKVVLIENEFGEIGIDGGFLKEAGIEIREMNSGCICCSLVGDFGTSLKEVIETYQPERILIEPSGVGKLSDVTKAVNDVRDTGSTLNSAVAVVDAMKCKMYIKNFGEFFINQIENAGTIILSRTDKLSEEKINTCVEMIREYNKEAVIITTPWEQLDGQSILEAIEKTNNLAEELLKEMEEQHHHDHGDECSCGCHSHHHEHVHEGHEEHGHHHEHHHEHDADCTCGCHDHDKEEHNHHHEHGHEEHGHEEHGEHGHHHEHDADCTCGCHDHDQEEHEHHHNHEHKDHEHAHHHEHGVDCTCGCHDHDHEGHHHDADEVFGSWGVEAPISYGQSELREMLGHLEEEENYGIVLRAKGMIKDKDSENWIYFDYVPGEMELREGKPDYTGKICVIGSKLKEENLKILFQK